MYCKIFLNVSSRCIESSAQCCLSPLYMHVSVHSHVLFLSMHQCGQLESSYFCHLIFDYFYKDLAACFMSRLFISCSIWLPFQCLMCMVFCCSGIIFIHLSFLHTPEILWNHQCSWWLNDWLFSVLCWIGKSSSHIMAVFMRIS